MPNATRPADGRPKVPAYGTEGTGPSLCTPPMVILMLTTERYDCVMDFSGAANCKNSSNLQLQACGQVHTGTLPQRRAPIANKFGAV